MTLRRIFLVGNAGNKQKKVKESINSVIWKRYFEFGCIPLIDNCLKICETILSKMEQQPVQIVVSAETTEETFV